MALHQPILVIDDDTLFASVVSKMLTRRGFLPVQCYSMEDAIETCKGTEFALAITDIYMPGMGGIEGIKALRAQLPSVKIVAMSGGWEDHSSEEALTEARRIGANWALSKPFTADELNEAIACVMDGRAQPVQEVKSSLPSNLTTAIVEDDPLMGKIIARGLQTALGDFLTSTDGVVIQVLDQAPKLLDAIQQDNKPDFVMTDLNMPEMDGLTLLRHLTDLNYDGGVCLVTGEDKTILKSAEALAKTHHLNFVGALQKPVQQDELKRVLHTLSNAMQSSPEASDATNPIHEDDLQRAIREGEVEVHYQPKISTTDKNLVGVEALIRWRHPELGLLFPGSFIPFAEKRGLIDLLTDAVVISALQEQARWREAGMDIKVSINLSSYSLGRLDFPEFLSSQAEKNQTSPDRIIVEITEGGLADDPAKALEIMSRLRLKGFGLSIDDFGTGYSSLSRLEEAPFNEFKIDRSFVAGATDDEVKRTILESSVSMAHKLNVDTVAEGVETQEDWDLVTSLGVTLVQGYFMSKPLTSDALLEWENKRNHGM